MKKLLGKKPELIAGMEIVIETEQEKSARMAEIERFSEIIRDKRKDAVEARRASGIEEIWQGDEDAYEGRDKYNRKVGGLTKPRTMDGAVTETKKAPPGRSTVIPNITRPYCDAAAARVSDMLIPTDDRNWAIQATPDPKLVNNLENPNPADGMDGKPMMKPAEVAQGDPMAPPQQPQQPAQQPGLEAGMPSQPPQPMVPVTVGEVAQQTIDAANKAAKRAQTVIDDWLVECQYNAEVRKVIECIGRIGTGILKGPVPEKKKARSVSKTPGGWVVKIEEKVVPVSKFVNPWNFYPDPNCGDDIKKGSFCFERDNVTARELKELKGQSESGYIDEMIELCLEEGAIGTQDSARKRTDSSKQSDKDLYDIWYFHGYVSERDMKAAGCECDKDYAPCVVTMVNDRIIKITMSPLDSGELPYDVLVWQQMVGHWAGIGVSSQIRTCQTSLTKAVRSMDENAMLSSGPQIIIDSSKIEPADGKWHLTPNKIWRKKLNAEGVDDVRQAFTIVTIETRQIELLNIINYWTKAAETITGLPMLLQGQQGNAPPTLGATQIVNNNGSTVLRRIARTFDDNGTVPHIGRYYEWLMLHGPEDAKGDFQIEARGSSALVERDLQSQALMSLLGASVNSAYQLDPAKVMIEVLKSQRFDPKIVVLDDEQKAEMANRQPPEDPRITAAKIAADARMKLEEMDDKDVADHALAEARLEMQRQQFEAQQADLDRQNALAVAVINERMKSTELTSGERNTLAKIKAELAQTSAKLSLTKDLATAGHVVDLHKNKQVMQPVIEPAGKAPKGQAWQK